MRRPYLLACLTLLAVTLHAANLKKYTLRIQAQKDTNTCSNCAALNDPRSTYEALTEGPPSDTNKHYRGSGTGLLFYPDHKFQAFDFTYRHCMDPVPVSNQPVLAAKWKRPEHQLDALLPRFSPKKPHDFNYKHPSSCRLNIISMGPMQVAK